MNVSLFNVSLLQLLEAIDSCTFEAMPNAFTREEIRSTLCVDDEARNKLNECMTAKRKEIKEYVTKDEMQNKFALYKTCLNDTLASI